MDAIKDKIINLLEQTNKSKEYWDSHPYERDQHITRLIRIISFGVRIRYMVKRKKGTLTPRQERHFKYLSNTLPVILLLQEILEELRFQNGNLK